ncbi:IS21 family transposase [Azohydromonas aeria]|uniref:IS21 family transposase n=1 Tax=Azohydromonas aeria TaxID=2590212 RepID=UPI0012F96C96|nr:IS21 family transposase [Azohydromonas aeria]
MTISPDLGAEILRLHHAELWPVGTIAYQLGVHHSTVRRVLAAEGLMPHAYTPVPRPSRVDPYRAFMAETLAKYPTLTASRLYVMVCERGYAGCQRHFRELVAGMRPRPAAQAYLRLRTLPGEQAQVDWAHMGHIEVGRARRPLMAFVMVLSYSRRIYLRFFMDARMDSFLRGHVEAFMAHGGCARILLYDNLKSAVLERVNDAIRFNPTLLRLASHYRFEPRPVAVARGNEKGRVERAINYIRMNFFAARSFTDLADLNDQARRWCDGAACERPWPEDQRMTVGAAFEAERSHLLPLPSYDWVLGERVAVAVGKTPYVRFDLNDYSVPHTHVQRTLAVLADEQRVRIFDGPAELACHARCWDRGQQIEDPAHVQDLVVHKRQARQNRGYDQLAQAAPASAQLLQMAAARGHNLGAITAALLRLLQRYGAQPLQDAILDAIGRGVPHHNAVSLALERAREAAGLPPPIPLILPEHVARRDAPVRPHSLEIYDRHGCRPEHPAQDQAED